ncbi:YdcF family protein [Bartonella sp. F02]|uniref:YdcF family protein n=1 Tax=Bartonella sp. F02 TaxID=2967262 RepID=UPI0022A98B59|nr:YdcF family protein [Bartonella sp. F02]MCZ2328783.1 YdcF family protein [Bartonella sp. F02]
MTYDSSHSESSIRDHSKRVPPQQAKHTAHRWNRFFRYLPPTTLSLFLTVLFFCMGFIVFSEKIVQLQPPNSLPKADAIIVFTGGSNRIKTGLNLLQQELGSRLLISGVNRTTNPKSFMRTSSINPQLFACCVDIGREATNTKGNALESAAWIKKHHYKTLYIVTHDYHMWRSLLELKHLMPDINFIAYPVKKRNTGNTIQQINYLRLLAFEYLKMIGVHIRIAF